MHLPKLNISPAARISIGLIALLISWLLLLELLIGIWPDQQEMLQNIRKKTSENIALNTSVLLHNKDFKGLKKFLEEAIIRDDAVLSAGIRLTDGMMVVQTAQHKTYWKPTKKLSTLDFVHVDLKSDGKPWGRLEIAFRPLEEEGFFGWIKKSSVTSLILVALGGLLLFSIYLKKILHYLDPSSVIPDRVRLAFDSFSEGVMMIDRTGRIVLVNKTLSGWVEDGDSKNKIFGKNIKQLHWLRTMYLNENKNMPWNDAMETREPVNGWNLEFKQISGELVKSIVNCSPIQDASGKVRGCLITFDNVTELDQLNNNLKSINEELMESRAELDKQNEELRKLATRDPMTNCLNRRAFFEMATKLFNSSKKSASPLCCIMTDIDHFKQFNDRYGHAVGDKVIVSVARALFSGLRAEDLFCRYGGEEFCILLPEASMDIAQNLAERLRKEIENKAGPSIRTVDGIRITSSFGIAMLTSHSGTVEELIDQADQALYEAKKGGRNCVKVWGSSVASTQSLTA